MGKVGEVLAKWSSSCTVGIPITTRRWPVIRSLPIRFRTPKVNIRYAAERQDRSSGEYMLSLEATDIDINNPQYWSWGKANEEFVKGAWCGKEEMTANFPEFYCVYDTKVNGSGQVACKTSPTWAKRGKIRPTESFAALSKKWLGDYTVASNFNITTFDGYYYVTFDKAGDKGICVTRCKIAGGDWESWNGSGWSADGKATVWTSSTPVSLVGKDGAVYAYYMDGDNVVSVKYAGGDNWPASGQQSVGYAFTERRSCRNRREIPCGQQRICCDLRDRRPRNRDAHIDRRRSVLP